MFLSEVISLSFVLGVIITITPKSKHSKYFYDCYLNSPKWRKLRRDTKNNHNGICYYCKKPIVDKFHLHHVNADYGTLGQEMPCDVVPCHIECHTKEHKRLNARSAMQKLIDKFILWVKRCYYSLVVIIKSLLRFIKLIRNKQQ